MVGPVLPRVTSSEGLSQDEHHIEKPRWQPQARSTPHYSRQQQVKHYHGGDPGKRIGQRGTKGADHRLGGAPDVTGRINLPSSACSSGRSNLDRFLEETTPRVKTQTLRKSSFGDSLKRTCNPEETPFFNLGDLWDSFDEWSAYGTGVPLDLKLNGDENVVQYYVPYLSALQLYTARQPNSHARRRYHQGSDSDTGSEASSDGESEKSFRDRKGAESPPPNLGSSSGNSSVLECKMDSDTGSEASSDGGSEKSFRDRKGAESPPLNLGSSSGNSFVLECKMEENRVVWSYFEKSPPYCRVPLVDKIADLSRDFEAETNPLRTLRSFELLPNSWFSVAWYPIYRIPTGPTLRDLAACFLTFHPLSTSLPARDGSLRPSSGSDVCVLPTGCPLDVQKLRAFGLASYKLRGTVWSSTAEKRLATTLEHSAYEHLTNLGVREVHPDFNYFTSHTVPICR